MVNSMTRSLCHSSLMHYGKMGMHWGIRRYQPYGEGGYDPDHYGKEIGLAARLAGHTGSYSDAIRRGTTPSLKDRARIAGQKMTRSMDEFADRVTFAVNKFDQSSGFSKKTSELKEKTVAAGKNAVIGMSLASNYYKNEYVSSLRKKMQEANKVDRGFDRNYANHLASKHNEAMAYYAEVREKTQKMHKDLYRKFVEDTATAKERQTYETLLAQRDKMELRALEAGAKVGKYYAEHSPFDTRTKQIKDVMNAQVGNLSDVLGMRQSQIDSFNKELSYYKVQKRLLGI